jgi:hypothetical protein
MNHDGWIGVMRQLTYYLSVVNCDRDEHGKFCVDGSITTFMGMDGENAEVVVGGDAVYYVDRKPKNLAAGLKGTSYGMGVKVI